MAIKKTETNEVTIKPINKKLAAFRLKSITPMMFNRFTEESLKDVDDGETGKGRGARKARVPDKIFKRSLHWLDGVPEGDISEKVLSKARFGFPTSAFKSAFIDAIRHVEGLTMVGVTGLIFPTHDMVEFKCSTPHHDSRWVRIPSKGKDGKVTIAHRAMIDEWECDLELLYDADQLTTEQIASVLNRAGFHVGVGAFSPRSKGSYGMFEVI